MPVVIFPALLLTVFGFFNLLGINSHYAQTQLAFIGVGLVIFLVVRAIGVRFFRANARLFYWVLIIVLAVTYIIGLEVKGSRRWLDLYFFNFQSSEILKVFFIIFLAQYLSTWRKQLNNRTAFFRLLFYFLLPTAIVFKQPDLGNALVFSAIFFTMAIFSTVSKRYLVTLAIVVLILLPPGWLLLRGYQRDRIMSFINPNVDPQGIAYNMNQAMVTIGSGGFIGKGLGLGTQARLAFLPENHTDFAYASLVEQFGFAGGLVVIGLFAWLAVILLRRVMEIYAHKPDQASFGFFYGIGLFAYIFFQTFLNLGMNMGLFPIAGVALPFISYGGSSLVALMIGLAIW